MRHYIGAISLLLLLGACDDKDANNTAMGNADAAPEEATHTAQKVEPLAAGTPEYQTSLTYLDIDAVNVLIRNSTPSNPDVNSKIAVNAATNDLSLILRDTLVAAATNTEALDGNRDHVEVYSDTAPQETADGQPPSNNDWSSLEGLFKVSDTKLLAVGRQLSYSCPANTSCKPTPIRNNHALSLTWFELNPQTELNPRDNAHLNSEYLATYKSENTLYVVSRSVPAFMNGAGWESKSQRAKKEILQTSNENNYLRYRSQLKDGSTKALPATRGCYTETPNTTEFELGFMINVTAFALDTQKLVSSVCLLDEISAVSLVDDTLVMQTPSGKQHQFGLPSTGIKYLGSL